MRVTDAGDRRSKWATRTRETPQHGNAAGDVAGDVFVPADARYDRARRASDLAAGQCPAVVVSVAPAVDTARAVRFARSQEMRIVPQGTGHGALPLELMEGALLLTTSRMHQLDMFPAAGTARAQAGARWEDVAAPAGEYGLAALAGTSPNVGVTHVADKVKLHLDISAVKQVY